MTPDSVTFCIKDLLNSCGIKTRVEVYKAACDANGLELLPICIEFTGRWGKACDDFFRKVLKTYSKGNESVYRASSNYWLSRLSCCLQKSIAASIVNRSTLINGNILHNPNYQFDEDFILESGCRH
jgi:hypothetical protein